jgi:hypothetical protein
MKKNKHQHQRQYQSLAISPIKSIKYVTTTTPTSSSSSFREIFSRQGRCMTADHISR